MLSPRRQKESSGGFRVQIEELPWVSKKIMTSRTQSLVIILPYWVCSVMALLCSAAAE
jgi:hypothetical protein